MLQETNHRAELVGAFDDPIAENPTGVMQTAAFFPILRWSLRLDLFLLPS
jgi:hypothetical protein